MTKKDISKALADKTGVSQADSRRIVQGVFDYIIDTLNEEGGIELRNFGVFKVKTRKPRKARNPKTGETVMVPERRVVTFKPGKIMEERITFANRPPTASGA
jgi:nucleoid DNA-binding protein